MRGRVISCRAFCCPRSLPVRRIFRHLRNGPPVDVTFSHHVHPKDRYNRQKECESEVYAEQTSTACHCLFDANLPAL
jgi:hypothetical protein